MTIGANVFIGAILPPETLRAAYARAYEVPASRVALLPDPPESWPDADVVLECFGADIIPGDYPIQVQPWGPDTSRDTRDITRSLAVTLGVPVLTPAESDDPEAFDLVLPNGTIQRVSVMQDEDDGFRNTPEMQRLIATNTTAAARAA
jgi:hypothetical protein